MNYLHKSNCFEAHLIFVRRFIRNSWWHYNSLVSIQIDLRKTFSFSISIKPICGWYCFYLNLFQENIQSKCINVTSNNLSVKVTIKKWKSVQQTFKFGTYTGSPYWSRVMIVKCVGQPYRTGSLIVFNSHLFGSSRLSGWSQQAKRSPDDPGTAPTKSFKNCLSFEFPL